MSRNAAEDQKTELGLFRRLTAGLAQTRRGLSRLYGNAPLPEQNVFDELETRLLCADVGVEAAALILAEVRQALRNRPDGTPDLRSALYETLCRALVKVEQPLTVPDRRPFVILVVGVNGAGKTTTVGKLARLLSRDGHSLLLAAGDTFRAAAIEQLQYWGEQTQSPVIAQRPGADPGAVIYNALQAATAKKRDIVIADTAGRLHNKDNLMEELNKIVRIIRKFDPVADLEILLTLDAGAGQNAVTQAKRFHQAVGVTGLALTKLDGSAKGGMIFSIARGLPLPVRFLGVGETDQDLQPFRAEQFVRALLGMDA